MNIIHPEKIFRNSSAAEDVVTEEYLENSSAAQKYLLYELEFIHSK
jgi:hypothetical protein